MKNTLETYCALTFKSIHVKRKHDIYSNLLYIGEKWYQGDHHMTSKFDLVISEIVLGSKYNSSDLNFKGKLSELNIWDDYNINIDPEVCSHVKPEPNILKWSDVDDSMINGTFEERNITDICHKSTKIIKQVVPVQLTRDRAMKACHIMDAKLTYPTSLNQFKQLKSRNYYF